MMQSFGQPNSEVWYKTSDGNAITLYNSWQTSYKDANGNSLTVLSNTYTDKGVIKFNGDLSVFGNGFKGAPTLINVMLPKSVIKLYQSFFNCTYLISVDIPNGLQELGDNAFQGCYCIESIKPLLNVIKIDSAAFSTCKLVRNIEIGDKITSIGDYAFNTCSIDSLIIRASTPPTTTANSLSNITKLVAIKVPADSVDAYKVATNWSTYASKITSI